MTPLDGGEWTVSYPSLFTHRETVLSTLLDGNKLLQFGIKESFLQFKIYGSLQSKLLKCRGCIYYRSARYEYSYNIFQVQVKLKLTF
jgi:hypothetical protein